MSRPVQILYNSTGLNNRDDPARLTKADLSEAVDVFIERNGRIIRRTGYQKKMEGAYHSGWSNPLEKAQNGFVVGGDTLYSVSEEGALTALVSNLTHGAKMAYVTIGPKTYYSNTYQKGSIQKDGTIADWVVSEYVGPDTDRVYEDPPLGHVLGFYGGRALVGVDRYLFHSELYAYGWFNFDDGYTLLDSRLRLIVPVDGGVFVSTEKRQYFFAGEDIPTAKRIQVAGYPAHEGFFTYEEGQNVGSVLEAGQDTRFNGRVALWSSPEGICLGTPDGRLVNLTQSRLVLPHANSAAGIIHNKRLINLLKE